MSNTKHTVREKPWGAVWLTLLLVALIVRQGMAAEQYGQVTFSGLPLPGATVTATQSDKKLTTVSDQRGIYRFADLADGAWTIRVEMLGFSPVSRDVMIAPDAAPATWDLKLLAFEEITGKPAPPPTAAAAAPPAAGATVAASQPAPRQGRGAAPAATPATPNAPGGFQRAGVNSTAAPARPAANAPAPSDDTANAASAASAANGPFGATDGLLINGSTNNGAASPFAQAAAFGNNRPGGGRSLYNYGAAAILGNSSWDARPYSFGGQQGPKPSYTDAQFGGTFGGPIKIPHLIKNGPTLLATYQHSSDHSATTQSTLVPTSLERQGDFSQSVDGFGHAVVVRDPTTGLPFAGNVIPAGRITPQAAALLNYYPAPNVDNTGRSNYESPLLVSTRTDALQTRLTKSFRRNQLFGNFAYQRSKTDSTSVFGFSDSTTASGIDTAANWSRRLTMFMTLRARYQFTRLATNTTPFFSNRTNVSGDAAITGNDQDPTNWGPPTLVFSSAFAPLSDGQYARNRNHTNAWNVESQWSRGRHSFTFGGDFRRLQFGVQSQQDARGSFTFTGAASGSDFGDFLLGLPHSSAIAFGNADKRLRQGTYDAYVNDDWRVSPVLTLNVGLRWEYEAPVTEQFGRLSNLDVAPDFSAVSAVDATNPVGATTGQRYPRSLLRPDKRGIQPRLGFAWRPVPGSSLVIRGGYGIYRNTSVYQPIAMLLAQQPPFSKTSSVETSALAPLTLANGFVAPGATSNTFAVNPDLRVGYAQNWQVSAQRDLPASLTISATYFGTHGSHLMQEFLPNTYPIGATNPCPACPTGFIYLTSNGTSNRHAGQVQIRRRLRNGLTSTVQYTLAKATDNATAFGGVSLSGASIAQNWQDLEAERGPSSFDQRHQLSVQFQYTTGIGVRGGALLDGVKGALIKGWTVTSTLTAGSGLPVSPVYFTTVPGTGIVGTIRPDLATAASSTPDGYYFNPASYAIPASGQWGTAGRNSIRGPAQFALNAGIARTFTLSQRVTLDWRIDATNVLNRVTFSNINTTIGSPQFGLPSRANQMRKLLSTLRLRF